jgi:hypothetical protein
MPNLLTAVRAALLEAGVERYRRGERDGFDCAWEKRPGGRVVVLWRHVGATRNPAGFTRQETALRAVVSALFDRGFRADLWGTLRRRGPGGGVIRPRVTVHISNRHPFEPRARGKTAAPAAQTGAAQ